MGFGAVGVEPDGDGIDHLDGLFRWLPQLPFQAPAITDHGLLVKHGALKAELDVFGGQGVSVVEDQSFFQPEGPAQPVGVYPPLLGHSGADTAIL